MSRIFISYSSKSKNLVQALVEDLEMARHQIWFDHQLTGGQGWWDQILENIRQCDLFIFALTPDALNSYPCQLEYNYAHQLNKNILPVLLTDGVSPDLLPPELSVIQFVDYRTQDRQSAFRLVNALNNLPSPRPLPDPLPEAPAVPISYLGSLKEQIEISRSLSFEEQTALIFKLKDQFLQEDQQEDVLVLLRAMKRREDLFAKIDKEIDTLLTTMPKASLHPKPRRESVFPVEAAGRSDLFIPPRLKWYLLLLSALIVGAAFAGGFEPEWYKAGRLYPRQGGAALMIVFYIVHGIGSALLLRTLERSPQQPITPEWLLNSAWMGGPLNGFLLRRILPSIHRRQILLVTGGWLIALIVGAVFPARDLIVNIVNILISFEVAFLIRGVVAGLIGGWVTYYMLVREVRATQQPETNET
jgi:hypothetical protein